MGKLARFQDWPTRLSNAIVNRNDTRFEFGTHDCCISACDLILAMTGGDIAEGIRGYVGASGVREVFKEYGGVEGVAETVCERFGFEEIDPAFAQRGDVCMCAVENGDTMAIISDGKPIVPIKKGWGYADPKDIKRAWRVG